ncbi:MAG TPA: DNA polymerase [Pyrinomonadaceae bacterium]|nr:DNA polymerase [Pyrinomonadaceae bacterium]
MKLYFEYVRDASGIKSACEELAREPFLGLDTETTELDPYRGDMRLVQLSSGRKTFVFDMLPFRSNGGLRETTDLAPLRSLIGSTEQLKVLHNAKFDAKWIMHELGCEIGSVFDTYLASQLIAAGESDRRHGLADVAQFFTGTILDKTEQISDWGAPELSHSQIEYAARDAAVLPPIREQMAERLKNDGLDRVAALEFECVIPIAEMELSGFAVDCTRWLAQLETVKTAQARAADELHDMLSAGVSQASLFGRAEINLDSQQQVAGALTNLGIPMPETTRAWQLQPLADEYPVVRKLLEYRGVQKAVTSFGENFLEFVEPKTNRIHADFRQIGAPTGRFSCSNPNLQQIPHDTEYRGCFRAPAGRKLVIADYSQIELRILADFSGDKRFIEAFASGADFHRMTASQVFGVKPEDVTDDQRSFAKRLNFGIVYGVGASRFGMMTGLSQNEAENTMRRYFSTYRKLDAYLRDSANRVTLERTARTASGRMLRLRFDETDRQSVGAARRYGVNMPIQGTSADILKRALRKLHESLRGSSAKLVNIVHDEIVVECDESAYHDTSLALGKAMSEAGGEFISSVPVKVDVRVSDAWAK